MEFNKVLEETHLLNETKINQLITLAKQNDARLSNSAMVGTIKNKSNKIMNYDEIKNEFATAGLNLDDFEVIRNIANGQTIKKNWDDAKYAAAAKDKDSLKRGHNPFRRNVLRTDT